MFYRGYSERRLAKREATFHAARITSGEQAVRSVAGMLCLARTGVECDDNDVVYLSGLLEEVATRCNIEPEQIAEAIFMAEPDLRRGWQQEPPVDA